MKTLHYIDAETVHNWRARYQHLPYFADLSTGARLIIGRAHDDQGKTGARTAGEWAMALVDDFPDEFKLPERGV